LNAVPERLASAELSKRCRTTACAITSMRNPTRYSAEHDACSLVAFQDCSQILWNRHRTERVDVCPACVTHWKLACYMAQWCQRQTRYLPEYFAQILALKGHHQHVPVGSQVE